MKKLALTTETLKLLETGELLQIDGGRINLTISGCEKTGCCRPPQSNSHCFAGC